MDRKSVIKKEGSKTKLFEQLNKLYEDFDAAFKLQFDRSLPFNETFFDRWERAKRLGFGSETSIYDNSFVFGDVKVGAHCWIGPYTIIDGSGGLTIGDYCTISTGVHIYTHDNVKQTLTSGRKPIERSKVSIGNNVYIAPNAIITKGVKIGDFCVIAANSLVNKDVPSHSIVMGQPGVVKGKVVIEGDDVKFEYFKD